MRFARMKNYVFHSVAESVERVKCMSKHGCVGRGGINTGNVNLTDVEHRHRGVGSVGSVITRNGGMCGGEGNGGELDVRAVSGMIISRSCCGVRRNIFERVSDCDREIMDAYRIWRWHS